MAAPRFSGTMLRVMRTLVSSHTLVRALWPILSKDFQIPEIAALPASSRDPVPDGARPRVSRPPRQWASADAPVVERAGSGMALRRALSSGQTTPTHMVETLLARLDRREFGHVRNSPFVGLDRDRALADAAASDARWKAGAPRSTVDGMIIPVKDEFDLIGLPTLGGTTYRTTVATADSAVVQRLRNAGAIVFGKTHATEFGLNPLGHNPHFDVPRNPWREGFGAGGSSLGAGAAVALGLVSSAVGSDGGGSVRIPAAFCGVYGLKPTFVRVSRVGDTWGGGSMAHVGPIAASVEDLVSQLSALEGVDPEDPGTLAIPSLASTPVDWRAALSRGVKGARIGVDKREWEDADPAVAAAGRAGLAALERAGAVLVDVSIGLARYAPAIGAITIGAETRAGMLQELGPFGRQMSDDLFATVALLGALSASDLLDAARQRARLRREVADVLRTVDLLALPTTSPAPAHPASEDHVHILDAEATARATRFAFLGNLTGLPAGTAPVGMVNGLPVGLQLIGDAWDEASVIAGLAELERSGLGDLGRPEAWRDPAGV